MLPVAMHHEIYFLCFVTQSNVILKKINKSIDAVSFISQLEPVSFDDNDGRHLDKITFANSRVESCLSERLLVWLNLQSWSLYFDHEPLGNRVVVDVNRVINVKFPFHTVVVETWCSQSLDHCFTNCNGIIMADSLNIVGSFLPGCLWGVDCSKIAFEFFFFIVLYILYK